MVLFVIAGLAGFPGAGSYSHRTDKAPDASQTIDVEPVVRSRNGRQVTIHYDTVTAVPTRTLFVGTHVAEPIGLQQIQPKPVNVRR